MDRWKSRGGKSQRRAEKKQEDQSRERVRERVRRKKMQVREKVEKTRITVFFQWFVAQEGRKVGSLKRRVRAIWPDERWQIACRCGAKHISKSKCTKHLSSGTLLEVETSKKCTPLRREAHFQVKSVKNWRPWTFRCRFVWQAQGILYSVKRKQNVKVLQPFQLQRPLHYTTRHSTPLHSTTTA